jgi:SAM-dependent methyltransferase
MTDHTKSSFYSGDAGKAYFSSHFSERLTFGRKVQSRYFAPHCRDDSTLLDFGCGDGTILRALPARRKIGVEINETCAQNIKVLNANEAVPITVYEDIAQVPDAVAHVAISNHSLEHVPLPLMTLKELRRVIMPGGQLVIVTPFDDFRRPRHRNWSADDIDRHLHTWSPRNLGNLVSEAGFSVIEARLCTFKWSPKIFWIHRFLGDPAFRLACSLLGWLKNSREVFLLARRG